MLFRKYKVDKFNMYISSNFMKNKVAIFFIIIFILQINMKYVKINMSLKEELWERLMGRKCI